MSRITNVDMLIHDHVSSRQSAYFNIDVVVCQYRLPYYLLIINTSLVRHSWLVAHIKKTGTKDEWSIVYEHQKHSDAKTETKRGLKLLLNV